MNECGAGWAFDVGFDTQCDLERGHEGAHVSSQPGNGGVVAVIVWNTRPTGPERLARYPDVFGIDEWCG